MEDWLTRIIRIIVVPLCAAVLLVHPVPAVLPQAPCLTPHVSADTVELTAGEAPILTRFTGPGTSTNKFGANGDLGILFFREDCSIGSLFGDSWPGSKPGDGPRRAPVLLRSNSPPGQPPIFDSAAGLNGSGLAPSLLPTDGCDYGPIPTDGISFPEDGQEVISYMCVNSWSQSGPEWATSYSGLAISHDGNHFERYGPTFQNGPDNTNPFEVMSMQRAGDYVYVVSVRAGRQPGPMMLQRVLWNGLQDQSAWQCWDGSNSWSPTFQNPSACKPVLDGEAFGEPSLRLLSDNTWALSYLKKDPLNGPMIVTRTSSSPAGPWTQEKIQRTWTQNPRLYGGYIDPRSTKTVAWLMVSIWTDDEYDVSTLPVSLVGTSLPTASGGE